MSSFGLKKSSAPEKRSVKVCGQLKMKSGLSSRFITFGAEVPHSSSAGELDALTKRWNALSGIVNSEPFCHSNTWRLRLPFLPDFGRAAAFDDQHDLLVEMPLDIERAGARHLDHIHAPQALGAVELDVAAAPAEPLPRRHRQVLHAPHADAAIDRHALRFHEAVVGHRLALELAEAGVLAGLGLVPMDLIGRVVHRVLGTVRLSRFMATRGRAQPLISPCLI